MVSVAGKNSGTAVFLCTGGGVPTYKKSKEISVAPISGKCRNGIFNQIMCMLQRKLDYVAYQPKIIIYLQPCFAPACLSVYGKTGKRRKSFYIHWDIYLLAGYGDGTCNSGRGV